MLEQRRRERARNRIEAVVAAAPGAPAHVLLDDTEAEHLPGCNLAIRRSALAAIGGFRVAYRVAGDDVDVCWRLRAAGGRLRFAPGAMVWHHRRYRVRAYLRQQRGYGHAEALLMRDHPERFGPLGGARWCGGMRCAAGAASQLPAIRHTDCTATYKPSLAFYTAQARTWAWMELWGPMWHARVWAGVPKQVSDE